MIELPAPARPDWDFPRAASGLGLLVDFAGEHGVGAAEALRGTGLRLPDLADGAREVTAAQELRVVRNLVRAVPGEAVGLRAGTRYHVSTFGIFGYALLASPTVGDAMNVALRFIDLSFAFGIPRAELEGERVRITLADAGLPPDVRPFLLERDLAAIHTVLDELLPGGVPFASVSLAVPAPRDVAPYAAVLGVEPEFDRPTTSATVDAAYLARPLPQANPQTVAVCEAICGDVVSRRRERTGLTQEVRVLLTQRVAFGGGMDEVAAELGLSPRTLRRRLGEEGTGFQALLDEVRASLAEEMLTTGRLSVEDVALRLGYAEASSFIHAFRRWTGTTPARFQAEAGLRRSSSRRRPGASGP
jgi:AraC-like DNA-binding protein